MSQLKHFFLLDALLHFGALSTLFLAEVGLFLPKKCLFFPKISEIVSVAMVFNK